MSYDFLITKNETTEKQKSSAACSPRFADVFWKAGAATNGRITGASQCIEGLKPRTSTEEPQNLMQCKNLPTQQLSFKLK